MRIPLFVCIYHCPDTYIPQHVISIFNMSLFHDTKHGTVCIFLSFQLPDSFIHGEVTGLTHRGITKDQNAWKRKRLQITYFYLSYKTKTSGIACINVPRVLHA